MKPNKPIPAIQEQIKNLVDQAFVAGMIFQADRSEQDVEHAKKSKAQVKLRLNAELLNERERIIKYVEEDVIGKPLKLSLNPNSITNYVKEALNEEYAEQRKKLAELKEGGE